MEKGNKQDKNKNLQLRFGVRTNYPVGDFLIRVKNAAMAKNKNLEVVVSKHVLALSEAMKKMGYFSDVKVDSGILKVGLAYKNKSPIISDISLVSKPGLRVYMGASEIAKKKGPSQYLISTPKGILSSRESVKQRLGGEVIAEIL